MTQGRLNLVICMYVKVHITRLVRIIPSAWEIMNPPEPNLLKILAVRGKTPIPNRNISMLQSTTFTVSPEPIVRSPITVSIMNGKMKRTNFAGIKSFLSERVFFFFADFFPMISYQLLDRLAISRASDVTSVTDNSSFADCGSLAMIVEQILPANDTASSILFSGVSELLYFARPVEQT